MLKSTLKGNLCWGVVNLPIQLYARRNAQEQIRLNMFHAVCGTKIKQVKTCPTCETEVPSSEISKGFPILENQFLEITESDLDSIRQKDDSKTIVIEKLIDPKLVQTVNYGNNDWVLLSRDGGQKSYALVRETLRKKNLAAIVRFVMRHHDYLGLISTEEDLLVMRQLRFDGEVKSLAPFSQTLPEVEVTEQEFQLAEILAEQYVVNKFDVSEYRNLYNDNLREVIENKSSGTVIVTNEGTSSKPSAALDLMAALKASVEAKDEQEIKPVPAQRVAKTKTAKKKSKARKSTTKQRKKKSVTKKLS